MKKSSRFGVFIREPLIHFLFIGVVLFGVQAASTSFQASNETTIIVTQDDLQGLTVAWASETGRAPSGDEIQVLIAEHVREEVLFREAQRVGLGEGDPVVRRHLAEKMQFLIEESRPPETPSDTDLSAAYAQAPEIYAEPATLSFSHIPFDLPLDGETRADNIQGALVQLQQGQTDWMTLGDPFVLSRTYKDATSADISRLFGSDFADALSRQIEGEWRGPVTSRLAQHIVRMDARSPRRIPPFEEVRDAVAAVETQKMWRAANEEALSELLERYTIILNVDG